MLIYFIVLNEYNYLIDFAVNTEEYAKGQILVTVGVLAVSSQTFVPDPGYLPCQFMPFA